MSLKILFLRPAEIELSGAVDYYNRQLPGLGYEFAAEVKRTLERVKSHPEAWHPLSAHTRRCRLDRFPYALVYVHDGIELVVLAVMHMSRHPDSWKDRGQGSGSWASILLSDRAVARCGVDFNAQQSLSME